MDDWLPVVCASAQLGILAYARTRSTKRRDTPNEPHKKLRPLGGSDMQVTVLGQGGAPLGDLYEFLDEADALGTLRTAHASGIKLFDTSPWYGVGLSESRFGLGLHQHVF